MSHDVIRDAAYKTPSNDFDKLTPLSSRSLFWRAGYMRKSTFLDHIPLLFWLVEQTRPNMAVTLGMADAVPHFAICQAVEKLNIEAVCWGVSTKGEDDLGDAQDYNAQHYPEFSQIITGSLSGAQGRAQIDLLVVNAPLTQALADEIDGTWLDLLSNRATVLFTQGGEGAIFTKYMDHLAERGGIFTVDPVQGVCLVLRGDQHDERLTRLAQLAPGTPGYQNVKHIFARVGELHRSSFEIRQMNSALGNTRKQRDEALNALSAHKDKTGKAEAKVAELADQLKVASTKIATTHAKSFDAQTRLEEELAQNKDAARDLRKTIAQMEQEQQQQQTTLAQANHERDAARDAHNAQLAEAETARETLRAAADKKIGDLRKTIAQMEQEQQHQQAALAQANRERDAARDETALRYTELATLTRAQEEMRAQRDTLRQQLEAQKAQAPDHLDEVATLTRLLETQQERIAQQSAKLEACQQAAQQEKKATAQSKQQLAQTKAQLAQVKLKHTMILQLATAKEEIALALNGLKVSKMRRAKQAEMQNHASLIQDSTFFDATWYTETYPDVVASHLSPLDHFVQMGGYEGRNPSMQFDSMAYHMAHPDVAETRMPALVHYLLHGKSEGRRALPVKT